MYNLVSTLIYCLSYLSVLCYTPITGSRQS
nr:MAG TPA: hypothetical protein [Caudoviricetes sp.]